MLGALSEPSFKVRVAQTAMLYWITVNAVMCLNKARNSYFIVSGTDVVPDNTVIYLASLSHYLSGFAWMT